jgi:hypothetical protein
MNKRFTNVLFALSILTPALALAQSPAQPSIPVEEIIRKFAAKEKEFKLARENYTYRQSVRVLDMGVDGSHIVGKHEMTEDVLYDGRGKRIEKVIYAPMDTLHNFSMSPEDEADLRNIQPFVLTSDEVGKYNLRYLGKQKVDEIDCYLFFVSPKTYEKGERYFEGQIWVDDRDLQIVKTYGKAVPDIKKGKNENIFPKFETYREQIDGKYWFPTYTKADDVLNFSSGAVHIQEVVKYENYKMFRTSSTITFGGEAPETKKPDDKKPDDKKPN